jgi:signal transduction histidine kinase
VASDGLAAVGDYLAQTRAVHVVRFGLDGDIQILNTAMAARLGLPEAPRGVCVYDYLTAPDAPVIQRLVRDWVDRRSPSPRSLRLNFCALHGDPFTLSCAITAYPDGCLLLGEPFHDDDERLQRQLIELNEELASLARDRQRSVLAEQRARHLAEADNRDKDDGLAVIAHELRQPLSTAMAALGVVKLNPAGAARALQSLDRQIGYMATLVEDLLHASQVMRGAVALTCEPTDVMALVRQAAEFIDAGVRERAQQLTIRGPDEPVLVDVDRSRMRQVLVNILSNAMKYTPVGGAIVVSIHAIEETACDILVRDTGEGMEAAALARVFDLFVRGTTGGNGLGIGLAVAKRLVELHGGTIRATSDGLGRGSTFVVTLPRLAQAPDVGPMGARASSVIEAAPRNVARSANRYENSQFETHRLVVPIVTCGVPASRRVGFGIVKTRSSRRSQCRTALIDGTQPEAVETAKRAPTEAVRPLPPTAKERLRITAPGSRRSQVQ